MNRPKSTSLKVVTGLSLTLLTSVAAHGQDPDGEIAGSVGPLPHDRRASDVLDTEPNPYGFPVQSKKETTSAQQRYSQEDRIREILSGLPITGMIGDGKKVLLGDLILEVGRPVEPVLPGQTERLLVTEITRSEIKIEWIEEFRRERPRSMTIPIDMRPGISVLLKGQLDKPEKQMGTAMLDEESDN